MDSYDILSMFACVVEVELGDDSEDARTVRHPHGYITVLNVSKNPHRVRFTCGHEIGHIALGHFTEFDLCSLTPREKHILDREADIFARELLMPEKWVREIAGPPYPARQLGRLKGLFGVSWDALIRRLDELGLQSRLVSQTYLREHAVLKSFDLPLESLPRNPLIG